MQIKLKRLLGRSEFYIFLIIVLFSFIIQGRSGLFFTSNNLVDLLRSLITPLIYALCAYLAFVSTGADVSFPMIAALSSYLAVTITLKTGYEGPVILTFLIAVFFGALMGAVNGWLIVKYRFPSLIVTLGTSSIYSGILFGVFNAGRTELPLNMYLFGKTTILTVKDKTTGLGSNLPAAFLIMAALYIAAYFILNHTMAGRSVFALGGDETSAERAGFNCKRIRFFTFMVIGALAAIGGMSYSLMTLRYLPTEYAGTEMTVIAAVILGGTRMTGGVGSLTGCVLGTLLLTMVTNSLILVGVPIYYQKAVIGIIIVIGTAVSALSSRKKYVANEEA